MELISKPVAQFLIAAVLAIAVLALGNLGLHQLRSMVDQAVQAKADERDAYWTVKIERANAEANKRAADQAVAVLKIQAEVTDKNRADQEELADLKVKNAHMPSSGDCGLSGDRVRMLPR